MSSDAMRDAFEKKGFKPTTPPNNPPRHGSGDGGRGYGGGGGGRGYGGGGGGRGYGGQPEFHLPSDYLSRGYFNDKGYPKKEVIIDWPQQIAWAFSQTGNVKNAKIRTFFNALRGIEAQFNALGNFDAVIPFLYEMQPKARYDVNRNVVDAIFGDFIDKNIALAVESAENFKAFVKHFQSVVAYAKDGGKR